MADRIIDDADVAVDELKRKARRRLLGAIVLALAAAILIPLLFEKEPKKLGEDVAIQIPPVDDSKFVSRLTVDKTKDAKSNAKVVTSTAVADPGAKSDTGASSGKSYVGTQPSAAPAVTTPAPEAPAAPAAATSPISSATGGAPSPTPKSAAAAKAADATSRAVTPSAKASASSETQSALRTETPPPAPPVPALAESPSAPKGAANGESVNIEGFVVQLAAFTDDKGANALVNRLKKIGYPAYTEPVETSRGTLWRVRVGGYPSRGAAGAARAKLKAQGHNGIVAAAK